MDTERTNRIGANTGIKLKERFEPDPSETTAVIIWKQNGYSSIMYDPWCSNKMAQVQHGHYHTSWARNIFFGYQSGIFKKPAVFDWKGKTVYIVGRGESVEKNLSVINKNGRRNPAIFLNTAYNHGEVRPQDFILIADNRILGVEEYRGAINAPLLSFPGIDSDIVRDNWKELYGFVPWTVSPLNNFMREIFPHLPLVLDILCVSVMATHLACLNGAKNIVFLGMDNTHSGDHPHTIKTKDIKGKPVKTIRGYYEMATAVCQFAGFARFHTKTRFINATGAGVLGVNYHEGEKLFPWVEQMTAEQAVKEFE